MATKGLRAVDAFAARMGMQRRLEDDELLKGLASQDKWPSVAEHINREGLYLGRVNEKDLGDSHVMNHSQLDENPSRAS